MIIIKPIKENKKYLFTGISLLAVLLWYVNFLFLGKNVLLNIICFLVYFFLNSIWLGKILNRRGFEKELQNLFGIFSLLFLIGFGMAIPIVVFKVTPIYLFLALIVLSLLISIWSKTRGKEPKGVSLKEKIQENGGIRVKKKFFLIWLVLFLGSLVLLFYSRTGDFIRSPWERIHPWFVYAWLGIVFLLGWLAFSKIKVKTFLVLIILTSLLCHAYLLIPYQTGFGGDKWRHIGAEEWLSQGNVYAPSLVGEEATMVDLGFLRVPEALVAGNKTSYANMWGLTIALSWLTGIKIFIWDLILGYLLFSIFLPLLLLRLGLFFSRKKEFLFLLLLMPFCFYPFQAYASISMPLSFSFLLFLFALIFVAKYLTKKTFSVKLFWALIFLIPFLYFNYLLYLILYLEILALAFLFKYLAQDKKRFLPLLIFFVLVAIIFIPILETYQHYSWFKSATSLKNSFKEMVKNFPVKLVSGQAIFSRIYGLQQDNWLYATVNRDLSRSVFFEILPWVFILTPLVWLICLLGLCFYKKLKQANLGWLLFVCLLVVLINQGLSAYFLEGNHLLSKRLVVFTSFCFFFPLSWGLYILFFKGQRFFSQKALLVVICLFLAFLSATVYASGPKFQVVTGDEHKAALYLWEKIKGKEGPHCVLANTWPLLALEGVSGREVITGGFPYYYEYRQPERVQLFENMNKYPCLRDMRKALEITEADNCYFMTERRWVYYDRREEIISLLDSLFEEHENIREVMLWHYQPK